MNYPKGVQGRRRLGMTQKAAAAFLNIGVGAVSRRVKAGTLMTLVDGSIDPAQFPEHQSANGATPAEPQIKGRIYWDDMHSQAKAKKAWLDLEKASGDLVNKREVDLQIFQMAREVRDRLQMIADRLAPQVARVDDPRRCRLLISNEIRDALSSLAESIDDLPEPEKLDT